MCVTTEQPDTVLIARLPGLPPVAVAAPALRTTPIDSAALCDAYASTPERRRSTRCWGHVETVELADPACWRMRRTVPQLGRLVHNPAAPPTLRAAAAVLVRLDRQVELRAALHEPKMRDLQTLQT